MAEILLQPLNGKNHPVSVAFFSRTVGRSWRTNDGFWASDTTLSVKREVFVCTTNPSRFTS